MEGSLRLQRLWFGVCMLFCVEREDRFKRKKRVQGRADSRESGPKLGGLVDGLW